MKKLKGKLLVALPIIIVGVLLSVSLYFYINMQGTSSDDKLKEITIKEGSITKVGTILKDNNLIKNLTIFKLYIKLTGKSNLKAGHYELSENMGVKKIIDILEEGSKINPNEISITFKEGINIRAVAKLISDNTNNSFDDVINKINDEEFIDKLIDKYWFITDSIKNNNIYYDLEGYLFPNTYRFNDKDVTTEDIITKMLDEMEKQLLPYKDDITSSEYNIHELMTLASIVELEGAKSNDRKDVAGVFYNRLNSTSYRVLGSDATTYYASKIDDWSYSLTYKELNDCSNKYNTRCNSNAGLPVGPICNPGIESITAVINPNKHDYYYFVADCKGEVYLTKNSTEHANIISKLKRENNWCA